MKLNWNVKKTPDGKFTRRKLPGDVLFNFDAIDVEWTHSDSFPEDTIEVPLTHPPDIKFETRKVGRRTVLKDQVAVSESTSDSTVALMLDEKRSRLAVTLGISE